MRTVAGKFVATESNLMKTFYLSLPAIALLAACGGGSTGVGNAPQFTTGNALQFTTLDGAVDELGFFIDKAERLDPTPVANLPTSGSAEYEGVFSLGRIFERFPNDPNPMPITSLAKMVLCQDNWRLPQARLIVQAQSCSGMQRLTEHCRSTGRNGLLRVMFSAGLAGIDLSSSAVCSWVRPAMAVL